MGLTSFYRLNGCLMTIQYRTTRRLKRISNWFLMRKLKGCTKLDLDPFPYLRGLSFMKIGHRFSAGKGLRLEAFPGKHPDITDKIKIGDNVVLNDYVHIGCVNRIRIGNNVLIGSKVYISDHNHGYYDMLHSDRHESPEVPPLQRTITDDGFVEIGDNVWIGELVSILPYTRIGKGCIIGANSVVRGDIPPYSIAVGSPARVIKQYDFTENRWVRLMSQ